MLMHLVCFKYNPEVDEEQRDIHRAKLGSLGDLDGIESLRVGADVVRSARSYDTGLAIVFRNRAALDAYQKHPRHVPIAQLGVSLSQHIVAVDFEL
jgi:hypothetical protein